MTKTSTKVVSLVLQANEVKKSVKSYQLSKKYVKRLMQISILNILYNRIDIPQSEFESKDYEKVPYVICIRKSQNQFIRGYHAIAHGIVDAIEKDYLKEMVIYILRKVTREPLETYNFKIKYNKESSKSDQKPSNEVRQGTMDFLKAITELPGKKWKQENVELFIELSYNEETPKEYEPPNFEATKQTLSSGLSTSVSLGKINTGFHKISAWGRGKNFTGSATTTPAASVVVEGNARDSLLEVDTEQSPQKAKRQNDKVDKDEGQPKKRKLDETDTLMNSTGEPICKVSNAIWDNLTIVSSEDYIHCVCKWDLPDEFETAKCTKCYALVHSVCEGYLSSAAIDKDSFVCLLCTNTTNVGKSSPIVKLRIILYGMSVHKCLPNEIRLATKDERILIFQQLNKFGIISSATQGDINFKCLNDAMQLVFQTENSQYLESTFSLEGISFP